MLLMVFAFMAVLMLMTKVRDPDTWSWMWALDGAESSQDGNQSKPAAALDTRPPARPEQEPSDVPLVGIDRGASTPISLDVDQLPESVRTAQLDGWDSVLQSLDRSQHMLLRVVLWNSRRNVKLDERRLAQWANVLKKLDDRWKDYHSRALLLVATDRDQLTDDQKRACLEVLELSKNTWEQQRESLTAASDPAEITVGQREQLTQLQRTLDQRSLDLVQDNAVLLSEENEAWFRLWERLTSDEEVASSPQPTAATYVQLFSQPNEYRGQLVKVHGHARMAYHARAAQNPFGIEGYYVFAVLPAEGGDNPLIVYCRDVPEGFPEIKDRDVDRQTTSLREEMHFTGYYFKRWVYQSRGGPNLAPLLIAKVTDWTPSATLTTPADAPPKFGVLAIAVIGLALLAMGFAWRVYRKSQWQATDVFPQAAADGQVSFDMGQVHPSVKQSLQTLADKPPIAENKPREEE
jgi:hypothetical protein